MPAETTVERQGTRSVPIPTTGHEKTHFTVALVAMANGKIFKAFVIFKGIRAVLKLA